jgi:heme exporter protein CcmD
MSPFVDPYALYVLAAYLATALILGALVWSSVAASRRARRELAGLEQRRERQR